MDDAPGGAPAATVDNAPLRGLRCPPPQPSPTCPQPSTMKEVNKTPLNDNKPPGNIPS
jgi:hypothetical protein